MNILLIFPMKDRETGLFIKNAFIELGHDVIALDPKIFNREQITEMVDALCELKDIDLIFMSRTPYLRCVTDMKEDLCGKPKIAFWNVDANEDIYYWKELFPLMRGCDIWFTKARGNLNNYRHNGLGNVHQLLQGIDPSVHTPLPNPLLSRFAYDVSFQGALDDWHENACDRTSLIDYLKANGIKLNLAPAYREAASTIYYHSKINIGSNHWPKLDHAISVRDFKIMGAGGFLLTNYVTGYEELFTDGEDLVFYHNKEECLELIRHYLPLQEERRRIALNGLAKTHTFHKYSDRMRKVIAKYELL